MNKNFWQNKTIVITGTSSGIGEAILVALKDIPCTIFALDREPSRQTCSSYACLGQGSAVIGLDGGLRGQGDFRC